MSTAAVPPRAFAVLMPLLVGCEAEPASRADDRRATDRAGPRLEVVARELDVPWDVEFAPDGRIFVTERPGRVRVVEDGVLRAEPWAELDVATTGEAGLLALALAPDFSESGHLYVVATFQANGTLVDRVIRFTERAGRGADPTVIVNALPANRFHAGSALEFGPDGMLYVTAGDALEPEAAQDPQRLNGKVLRYDPDGGIPADNPFAGSPVFALGVRNTQGLAWDAQTDVLFATDHGPSGMARESFRRGHDELNVIQRGGNYGWPEVIGTEDGDGRFISPIRVWENAIAPAGTAVYMGPHQAWSGDVFVGALRGRQLRRIGVERAPDARAGWRVVEEEALFEDELGRIRAVAMGPDGHLYFTTSNRDGRGDPAPEDDRVFRLVWED